MVCVEPERFVQRRWRGVAWAMLGCLVGCGGDADPPHDAGRDARRTDAAVVDNRGDMTVDASVDVTAVDGAREDSSVDVGATPLDVKATDAVGEAPPKADPTAVLGAKSVDCLSCAKARCPLQLAGCAEIAGTATDGPAKGVSRASLCVETLACVVPNGCAADINKSWTCYCDGLAIGPTLCYSAGPCKPAFERSMEATDPAVVVSSFSDTSKGGGWAITLLQCLSDNRCMSCLEAPPSDAGPVVDASADARRDVTNTDAAGGAGGSGGTGGTGTGTGGTGGSVDSGARDADAGDGAMDSARDSVGASDVAGDAAFSDAAVDTSSDGAFDDASAD